MKLKGWNWKGWPNMVSFKWSLKNLWVMETYYIITLRFQLTNFTKIRQFPKKLSNFGRYVPTRNFRDSPTHKLLACDYSYYHFQLHESLPNQGLSKEKSFLCQRKTSKIVENTNWNKRRISVMRLIVSFV